MYTGLIYNDIFSKSLNLFGSHWKITYNSSTIMGNPELQLDPKYQFINSSYPFGMDPVWQVARGNKIIFHNGYKMKISIIFGVLHMVFGVVMSLRNYRYFNDKLSIITQFIPQIIFLIFLFFYLAVLMFLKWIKYSAQHEPPYSIDCAPSILITFINMVLFKKVKHEEGVDVCSPWMYAGQDGFQKLLVFLAVLCIPWMLFAKPIHIMRSRKEALVCLKTRWIHQKLLVSKMSEI